MDPCDGGGGGQCSSPSDSGCAGEGVGLASSEGTSWRGDGGINCECGDYRKNKIATQETPISFLDKISHLTVFCT